MINMSDSCCSADATVCNPQPAAEVPLCPVDRSRGRPVEWLTVAALSHGVIPRRQRLWICLSPACEVVYFGEQGAQLTASELTVHPGFKHGSDGLLCYCFQHRRPDLARELAETGFTAVFDEIKGEVQAGNCACEVKNPTGRCCLGEVQAAIRELLDHHGLAEEK